MTNEKFEEIINSRIEKTKALLLNKAKEYATGKDRLHNFNVAARMRNIAPAEALDGFLLKHLVSYGDILEDVKAGKIIDSARIEEKLGDIITYFFLQECVLQDHNFYVMDKISTKTVLPVIDVVALGKLATPPFVTRSEELDKISVNTGFNIS